MSDQPISPTGPPLQVFPAPTGQDAAQTPPETPQAPGAAPGATPKPGLRRGQLVSYVVVDDAGNEHTAAALVVDVFDVTDVVDQVDAAGVVHRVEVVTAHARVAHLPAPLAISVAELTALS